MALDELAFTNDGGDHEARIVGQVEREEVTGPTDTRTRHGVSTETQVVETLARSDVVDSADTRMGRILRDLPDGPIEELAIAGTDSDTKLGLAATQDALDVARRELREDDEPHRRARSSPPRCFSRSSSNW